MKTFDRIFGRLEEWLTVYGVGSCIVIAMLYVSANVIARYVFHSPIKGMLPIVGLLMVPMAYLALAYGWRIKMTFIAATFLLDRIKGKPRWVMGLLFHLIALIILAGLIGYYCVLQTVWAFDIHHVVGGLDFFVISWPFRASMAFGCLLLAIRVIMEIVKHIRGEPWTTP